VSAPSAGHGFAARCRAGLAFCTDKIGPGVITGASDDDPSGIATYAIAGATLGYGLLWVTLITLPMMIAVQEMCARIALVTGSGLVATMRRAMPAWLLRVLVALVVAANTINIAADITGMSASAALVTPIASSVWAVGLGALLILVEVFASYQVFSSIVKWLCLALLAYIASAFVVGVDWLAALRHTVVPEIRLDKSWMSTFVAFLGTTITPYLFVWQAALEVEDAQAKGKHAKGKTATSRGPRVTSKQLAGARADVVSGMLYSNIVSWFIVAVTASTLFRHHTVIATVQDAARALRPLAGRWAELLFALGVLGAGLLAVPVLAGSSAYALAEAFDWKGSLEDRPRSAVPFYSVIAAGIALGVVADLLRLDAVWALFWSAVVNGFVAIPLLVGILLTANRRDIMGKWINSNRSRIWMIVTIALMTLAAVGVVVTA
jgi:NRAMP (natural resistance-associated macrophage protein)-like metal ion transporter